LLDFILNYLGLFEDALKCMQNVAEQINEMQKIFDEYGEHFDVAMKKFKSDRYHVRRHIYFIFKKRAIFNFVIFQES